MNTEPSQEKRLDRIEERLAQLERLHGEAQRREQRRRRQELWSRIGFALLVVVAYVLYFRYAMSIV